MRLIIGGTGNLIYLTDMSITIRKDLKDPLVFISPAFIESLDSIRTKDSV